jgi:hypothetical protein
VGEFVLSCSGVISLLKLSLKLGLFSLIFLANPSKRAGGGGRNRPDFPAVAPQICLILLAIQAKTVLSDPIVFNPFGVRFGVRFINPAQWEKCVRNSPPLAGK